MSDKYVPRMVELNKKVTKAMIEKYKYKNAMCAPRLTKISISCSHNAAKEDTKYLDEALTQITRITGRKSLRTKTRQAVSNFKTKVGQPIGCKLTLRRDIMWEFMDRFINIAIPRMRDFRGLSRTSFDKQGNYNIGVKDISVFPEYQVAKVSRPIGVGITFSVQTASVDEAITYLGMLGMPFKK